MTEECETDACAFGKIAAAKLTFLTELGNQSEPQGIGEGSKHTYMSIKVVHRGTSSTKT